MLYGKILRPAAYDAKLLSIDLAPARAMRDVVVVHDNQDNQFVGVVAPNSFLAGRALGAISGTAKWKTAATPTSLQPSSGNLFDYLRQNAEGGVPQNPFANEAAAAR
jgi:isoquinoline 1-oxidoreductase